MFTLGDMQVLHTISTKPTKHFLGGKTKRRKAPRRNRTKFHYETQPAQDIDSEYGAGALIEDTLRLKKVEVWDGTTPLNLRRYFLDYELSLSSANRSRLESVLECAGTPVDCLSPTLFTYQDGVEGLDSEIASGSTIPSGTKPLALDINGDGRTDLVYPSSASSGYWVYQFANASGGYSSAVTTGILATGYSEAVGIDYNSDGLEDILAPYSGGTWWVIQGSTTGLQSPPVNTYAPDQSSAGDLIAVDVNADGRDDLIYGRNVGGSSGTLEVRYRLASGGFSSTATVLFQENLNGHQILRPMFTGKYRQDRNMAFDYDGDGHKDVAISTRYLIEQGPFFRRGYDLIFVKGNGLGYNIFAMSNTAHRGLPVDLNGDGYTDLVMDKGTGSLISRMATGQNFAPEVVGPSTANFDFSKAIPIDWNSDGLKDLLIPYTVNNTWYFFESQAGVFANPVPTGLSTNSPKSVYRTDSNGDGLPDIAYVDTNDAYKHRAHLGVMPDLLDTAVDGFGNSVDFDYAPITDSSVYTRYYNAALPAEDYQSGIHVVKNVQRSTGNGDTYNVGYSYAGAQRDLEGRGLNGFDQRITHDYRNGNEVTEYYRRDFPYRGRVYKRELRLTDNTLVREISNDWQNVAGGTGYETYFYPYIAGTVEKNFEAEGANNGAQINQVTTTTLVDTYGTPYDIATVTDEKSTANGAQPGASYTHRTLLTSITNNTTYWCIGKPGWKQDFASHLQTFGAQITRTTDLNWDMGYDCELDQLVIEPLSPTVKVTVDLGYDGFGNENSRTVTGIGMPARTTITGWGATGRFPVSTTNALSQVTLYGWDYSTGDLLSVTDPNGLVTVWQYDLFGRRSKETLPDLTYTDFVLSECSLADNYCGTGFARVNSKVRASNKTTTAIEIRYDDVFFDIADRPVQTSSQAIGGGTINVRTLFDAFGRVTQQSAPDFATDPNYYTTIAFDALSRPKQISRPIHDGTSSLQHSYRYYEGLTVRTVDAENLETTKIQDALGRTYQSFDNAAYYQQFEFDAFGSIRKVQGCLATTCDELMSATYAYGIGALKLTSSDMNLGNWTYTPNALGEVIAHTDANSQSFTATFDKLGRPLTRVEPEGTTTWTWGTSAVNHDVGRLESVDAPGHDQEFDYDSYGRLSQHKRIGGGTYDIDYAYSSTMGLLNSVEYPVSKGTYRFKVLQEHDHGILKRVKRSDDDQVVYWEAVAQNAFGQVIDVHFGNGVGSERGFDGVSGRLDAIFTEDGSSTELQDLAFSWDKVGNLIQRKDWNRALTEDFFYDNRYRLDYSQLNLVTNLDVSYEDNGNIATKDDVSASTWVYHGTKKNAVITAGANSYTYDANGNMITRNGYEITWSSYNYPTEIEDGARIHEYSYGAHRQKWKQIVTEGASSETTYFVGGLYEKNVTSSDTQYRHTIYANGVAVAYFRNEDNSTDTATRYFLQDHEGSVDAILTASGSSPSPNESFDAFGQRRDPSDWDGPPSAADLALIADTSDSGYTEHLNLEASSLIHMNGRVMDAHIGRFLSADPYVPNPGNTQSFNRYSYVNNNPLSFTDPTGFTDHDFDAYGSDHSWAYYLFNFGSGSDGNLVTALGNILDGLFGGGSDLPPPNECKRGGPTGCYGAWSVPVDQFSSDVFALVNSFSQTDRCYGSGQSSACHEPDSRPPLPNIDWQGLANDWWPGYQIGTCLYDSCGGFDWSVSIIGATPIGKGISAGTRIVVNAAGEASLFVRGLLVGEHAAARMTQRGVSIPALEKTLGQTPFKYYHEGAWKTGFYDPTSGVFAGSINGELTTIINVTPKYIENLMKAAP